MSTTTPPFEPAAWDERYAGTEWFWSGSQCAARRQASRLTPGTALDVGCGEGGDVIWLAQQGWRVTGADFSANGLHRAARHAEQAGVADRVDWWQVDARTFEAGGRSFDLVTTHYLHPPDGGMVDVTRRLCDSRRPRRAAPGRRPRAVGEAFTHLSARATARRCCSRRNCCRHCPTASSPSSWSSAPAR